MSAHVLIVLVFFQPDLLVGLCAYRLMGLLPYLLSTLVPPLWVVCLLLAIVLLAALSVYPVSC
jgi:hypothetical protein